MTACGSVPGSSPTSTRVTPVTSNTDCAVSSGTKTVRPSTTSGGPSPATIPTTRYSAGSPAPRIVSGEPTASPSVFASRSVTSALGSPTRGRAVPATRASSCSDGSVSGSMPMTVTDGGRPPVDERLPRYVRRWRAGATIATPGVPSMAATVSGPRPVSPNAETRRSLSPTRSRAVRSADASMPAFVARPANSTATPRATPTVVRTARHGRATRLRSARPVRPFTGTAPPTGPAGRAGR